VKKMVNLLRTQPKSHLGPGRGAQSEGGGGKAIDALSTGKNRPRKKD